MIKQIVDQPPPRGDGRPVWDLVVDDMRERDNLGRARYNTPLRTRNGRDALVDAYQEALDLSVYLRQEIEERVSIEQICEHLALIPGVGDFAPKEVLETIGEIEERVHALEHSNTALRKQLAEVQSVSAYDAGFGRGCQAALHFVEKMQGKRVSNELLEQVMCLREDNGDSV